MKADVIWRVILAIILLVVAVAVIKWLFHALLGLLATAIWVAIIVGIVWLVLNYLGKRNRAF